MSPLLSHPWHFLNRQKETGKQVVELLWCTLFPSVNHAQSSNWATNFTPICFSINSFKSNRQKFYPRSFTFLPLKWGFYSNFDNRYLPIVDWNTLHNVTRQVQKQEIGFAVGFMDIVYRNAPSIYSSNRVKQRDHWAELDNVSWSKVKIKKS